MMEYFDGSVLIIDKYVIHKGQSVDTLIITKKVWEDPESKTCLTPFVWTAKRVIIINENGKFEDIKLKDKLKKKKKNINNPNWTDENWDYVMTQMLKM